MKGKELKSSIATLMEVGRVPFHPVSIPCDDTEVHVSGVSYRQWLIGQCLMGSSAEVWRSDYDNNRVADSIVSLVDAIIKRERQ